MASRPGPVMSHLIGISPGLNELTHWGRDKMAAIFRRHFHICIFLNENVWISIKISLKFVSKDPLNNIPSVVQIMAWCRPMIISLLRHICVTRPQLVKMMELLVYNSPDAFWCQILTVDTLLTCVIDIYASFPFSTNHDDIIKWKHFRVTGPLWGESAGQWISLTKASDAELWCFHLSAPEQTVE